MNTTLKKIVKGTLALFAIKLVFIGGLFIFQSCQSETLESRGENKAQSNFLSVLNDSKDNINTIKTTHQTKENLNRDTALFKSGIQLNTYEVCITDLTEDLNSQEDIIGNIEDLGDLIEANNYSFISFTSQFGSLDEENTSTNENNDTEGTDSTTQPFNPEDCDLILEVEIEPIVNALNPVIQEAKNYLYAIGYTEQELNDMITDQNGQEEDLIPLVMLMTSYEDSRNDVVMMDAMNMFFTNAYAQGGLGSLTWQDYVECAGIAIGINLIWSIGSENPAWKKKSIRKAFGKIASRFLGPIGVAIAVGSFAYCVASKAYIEDA